MRTKLTLGFLLFFPWFAAGCVDSLPPLGAPCPCAAPLVCDQKTERCATPVTTPDADVPLTKLDASSPDLPAFVKLDTAAVVDTAVVPDAPPSLDTAPTPDTQPGTDTKVPAPADECAAVPLEPGCGTNGVYYGNACDAKAAGVTIEAGRNCLSTGTCAVPQATVTGTCDRLLGWMWQGERCVAMVGCSCTGSSCTDMYPTLGACERSHFMCYGTPRCNEDTLTCTAHQTCTYQGAGRCRKGDIANLGRCVPRPTSCPAEQRPVCGCDGKTYRNLCEAHRAGTDVASDGGC